MDKSAAKVAKVREVFNEFDTDSSGTISSTEIKSALGKLVRETPAGLEWGHPTIFS